MRFGSGENLNHIIPTRIRQFPVFLRETIKKQIIRNRPTNEEIAFRLCYFTCASYFKYLYCSIESIKSINAPFSIKLFVFCDRTEMLSEAQCHLLKALYSDIEIIPWGKSQGWGADQITSIWAAYEYASKGCRDNDYIARVDSDVFFFSNWIFSLIAKSDYQLIGDGHYVDFKYAQGGVYFCRVDALTKIFASLKIQPMSNFLIEQKINVEDIAVYKLMEKVKAKIWITYFMMFPDEYRIAKSINVYQKGKFCCYHHSVKDKRPMIDIYLKEMHSEQTRSTLISAIQA